MHASFRLILRGAVLGACAVAPWVAQAQSAASTPVPAVVPVVAPTMQGAGSGQYVCGGVGSDESVAMRAAMKDHPLSLLFARSSGAYLADVAVTVKNESGATALSLVSNGPICHVDLPAGRYTVEASADGVTKSQVVTLGNGPKTADFRF
ncbi:carboxypeptidase-like regulatory domain-containing protein [Variovorax sp. J2P1-59]|uniref:carboxypeptidase-like regulatory domain-containing protein n=1 Tax=Variovorax flavidus TaxID=3053501 RepID=UPI002578B90C|nr:carboxypeptidase-like regulatory domain-containing protein [Variovorax sp. J2P1-59]MDM0077673.1 carboxypeptidase-like regulatory domain-containing protein [Variovorax sp. J2P1-59]